MNLQFHLCLKGSFGSVQLYPRVQSGSAIASVPQGTFENLQMHPCLTVWNVQLYIRKCGIESVPKVPLSNAHLHPSLKAHSGTWNCIRVSGYSRERAFAYRYLKAHLGTSCLRALSAG